MLPPNVDTDTIKRTNKSSPEVDNFETLWISAAEPSSVSSVLDKSYSFVPSGFISSTGSLEVFPPDSILSNMQNHTPSPRTASIKSCDSDSNLSSRTLHNVSELKMRIKRKSGNDKSEIKHEIVNSAVDGTQNDMNSKYKKGPKVNRCKTELPVNKTDPYDFAGKNEDTILPIKRRKIETHKISTKDCGVNTVSMGTMTQPDLLGPCEPGTSVTLNGIVWLETTTGILVVNVSWRGRTYVGSLMEATKHDFAPLCLRNYNSPFRPMHRHRGRGKRRKLRIAYWNGQKSGNNANRSPGTPRQTSSHNGVHLEDSELAKKSALSELPIACVHQTCSKRFVDVTALRYHLNQSHNRKQYPVKHSPSAINKRRRRSSALPVESLSELNHPPEDVITAVSSHSPVAVELFKTPSVSLPPNVPSGSVTLSDPSLTVSFPLIAEDLSTLTSAISTDSVYANCLPQQAYNLSNSNVLPPTDVVVPHLPVISTGYKLSGPVRHQVPAYLIDGVSPISSASSSAHESPVDKHNKLRRHNSMIVMKQSSPKPPDAKVNGMCPRLSYSEQESPAYSDISDSNDCPAPVLEKEYDIKRPDVPTARSPSVPLTPPCLSQPPSLLPAMNKDEEKVLRQDVPLKRDEKLRLNDPLFKSNKLASSASSPAFPVHPLPAHAQQPMFGSPFPNHIPPHLLGHHPLLPPQHIQHPTGSYSNSCPVGKLNGTYVNSNIQDLSIANPNSSKVYGVHASKSRSSPSDRGPGGSNYSSPLRSRPPISLTGPSGFHLSPHMPPGTLSEHIANASGIDHMAGAGPYLSFSKMYPHQ